MYSIHTHIVFIHSIPPNIFYFPTQLLPLLFYVKMVPKSFDTISVSLLIQVRIWNTMYYWECVRMWHNPYGTILVVCIYTYKHYLSIILNENFNSFHTLRVIFFLLKIYFKKKLNILIIFLMQIILSTINKSKHLNNIFTKLFN